MSISMANNNAGSMHKSPIAHEICDASFTKPRWKSRYFAENRLV